ncbi:ribosomal-protein-alanine N-acetyltransferase [Actinoplanes sp. OR16]|uniref:GNAT family N-acetyltransferase n=1 Tax=Actinoplanes sp. OR16 TaxID=946334 RepID=UPI000F6F6F3E|nr:GNAT family N-acetyltransferase [Actinoplanes sp. OR16]BBH70098.1 ribosomal-protein-alanine N-acetyltransferase [Actinoplanes sp. OR16]
MDPAVTQISERHWHALDDDRVIGRGEVSHRPDGRSFLSIDVWHDAVFDRLATAMLATLPKPLYTVVDEADVDLLCRWEQFGFGPRRREWEYVIPTRPGAVSLPDGYTMLPFGTAEAGPLGELDRIVRDEVDTTVGWHNMPAEVLAWPLDPSRYAVVAHQGGYAGFARIAPLPRQPRIALIAVRADHRRRGIAGALLTDLLGRTPQPSIAADVHQSNAAAIALFESAGGRRTSSNLELVLR